MAESETINPDQQTEQQTPESGLRFDRAWWLREEVAGVVPADPEWNLYSDLLVNFEAAIDPGVERVDGLGTPDAVHFSSTVEENEITVTYALQQPIVDENDQPNDAAADAMLRNLANQIPNTHAAVFRDENLSPGPDDPEGCEGQRQYLVMKGAKADLEMEPDTEEAQPTPVTLTYTPEKARSYHIYQPADPTSVLVYSDDESDTTQSVTIESEGGATTETLELDGTNLVGGTEEFDDIDAIHLDAETDGDVTVAINTADETAPEEGGQLAVIRGAAYYSESGGTVEGDLGVPALGSSSAPDPIGTSFEDFQGNRVERPAGTRLAPDLQNITLEVDNGLEASARQDSTRVRVSEGNREVTVTANVIGEKSSHELIEQAFAVNGLDLEWELTKTLFTFPEATVTDPPSRTRESDQTFADIETGFQPKGVQITQP